MRTAANLRGTVDFQDLWDSPWEVDSIFSSFHGLQPYQLQANQLQTQALQDGGDGASAAGSGATAATPGQAGPSAPAGGSVVTVDSGGVVFNLIYDAASMSAPASVRAGLEEAAGILSSSLTDRITVNIKVDISGTGGGGSADPDWGWNNINYSSVHDLLAASAPRGDQTFSSLPSGSTIGGASVVTVYAAQMKLFNLFNPNVTLLKANDQTSDDGFVHLATDTPNPVALSLHELTHALGRTNMPLSITKVPESSPSIFEFYRYTSPGTRLYSADLQKAPPAYFSLDGGQTKLADYGQTSDPADFLDGGVQGDRDPFNEFYFNDTPSTLSMVDLQQMHALGFHTSIPAFSVAQITGTPVGNSASASAVASAGGSNASAPGVADLHSGWDELFHNAHPLLHHGDFHLV
ncbi:MULTISPECIES: NF038122 family metalloprotease [Bradyrhizobium]|jgi:hypothetical protein|uniref:NF038122 family metalloprotease n=1 Tax=Bradyrhizobium denitrificans TaxID=2734912 RepID=A0ABS5G8X0_9BRAD|nr:MULTISPECIES: NF038122 family metalloprotease [Bradyrhizobium]MBR1137714.1 NF038122 family metalloprotease [Bradyrhizobium denitrificans]MDU1494898.1 NF038122 family metalloprotease [Bradyrhizobium sp.]MDU1544985.1 NF038122 family metalloprotease [Bradyrhizobium sp.]MDU1667067.1 NF038122 family metalloprotease [Bradyrhizobium sp.]MDU1693370.1 NF038122 family metalloprotease [Bradyrhizobium sp.]